MKITVTYINTQDVLQKEDGNFSGIKDYEKVFGRVCTKMAAEKRNQCAQLTCDLFAIAKFLFHIPLAFDAAVFRQVSVGICHPVWCGKTRMMRVPDSEKNFEDV